MSRDSVGSSYESTPRSLSGISEFETVLLSIDLVRAARRHIQFLRDVADSHWLHWEPTLTEAVRRYEELWMPLISDLTVVGSKPPMVLPPFHVQWVWYCHTLDPVGYRQYCESRFSKIVGKSAIFDEENEEYALTRCKEIWTRKYPSESFENEADSDLGPYSSPNVGKDERGGVMVEVMKRRELCVNFREPYMLEMVYLIAARQRYKGFLYMLQRFGDGCGPLVPTLHVLLMLLTHQGYPTAYYEDMKEVEGALGQLVRLHEPVKKEDVEATKKLWEKTFDEPYEKAGGGVAVKMEGLSLVHAPVCWEVSETDVNVKYKFMSPRFLMEVCVFVRSNLTMKGTKEEEKQGFLRLQTVRCHRDMKMDNPFLSFTNSWQKAWHLYCEFRTRGLVLELRHRGGLCLKGSKLLDTLPFPWNDLLRAPSLTLARQHQKVRAVVSITPPVQASYLLKCVPDRVTDDSGAMISDVFLRMNQNKPQEGRWLSRTVLDHAGRECFVVRMRVGGGFWRRGGETPVAVKWEDRIIEIRQGSWSYVAGSIGRAPAKVVATATPKEEDKEGNATWCFSTGDELTVQWETSASISGLSFSLNNKSTPDSSVKLVKGRRMQFSMKKCSSQNNVKEDRINDDGAEDEKGEEEGFITLIRLTEDDPIGKATALLNWKLLAVEVLPEEDAVFVLLVCLSILRSVSEMRKEDVGSLLIRRRVKEPKIGRRDWGSVILHPSSYPSNTSYSHLQPWHWNAKAVMASDETSYSQRQPMINYSPVEGGDKLYKRGIITS
ncbi:Glycine-rich domain-containing protein-like [Dillenia turbinata]|uniref:Glycine-rich domain-containing protein-like n=1 Tax=Dillenia turbinata TaxID=194707 RepID=A0AAN8YQN4_9MAGN